MIWPPQATGIFAYKTPCCTCPVVCYYSVGTGAPAESALAAQAYLDDYTAACIVDGQSAASAPISKTALVTSGLLSYMFHYAEGSGGQAYTSFKVYVPAACDITVAITFTGTSVTPYGIDAVSLASITYTGDSSGGVFEFPAAGYYIITCLLEWSSGGPMGGGTDGIIDFEITETDCDLTYCTLEADWDDGGGNTGTVRCE